MKPKTRWWIVALTLSMPLAAAAGDWPRWRGPAQDGISTETDLLESWPEGGPPELWRATLGIGFSGIVVTGGKACTQFSDDASEYLACFDVESGEERWRFRLGRRWDNSFGDYHGPRAAPTIDGSRIYASTPYGVIVSLDFDSGELLWARHAVANLGGERPGHGYSMTPLIVGGRVLLNPGGAEGRSIVALDKETGETLWSSLGDGASYAAPLAIEVAGMSQVVFFNAAGVIAVSPEDGGELWRYPWTTQYDINAATPIYRDGQLFISSEYDHGSALLELTVEGEAARVREVWVTKGMQNKFATSVLIGDHLYGFHRNFLVAVELATGEELWRERGFGFGSVAVADGKLIVLGDKGQLALALPSPEDYQEISRAEGPLEGRTWTVPTISGGRLYLRDEQQMVCLDLRQGEGTDEAPAGEAAGR